MSKLDLINEIGPKTTSTITTGRNETTIKIDVGLHSNDAERLHQVIADFLGTCEKTIQHGIDFNAEIDQINKSRGYE